MILYLYGFHRISCFFLYVAGQRLYKLNHTHKPHPPSVCRVRPICADTQERLLPDPVWHGKGIGWDLCWVEGDEMLGGTNRPLGIYVVE